MKFIISIFVYLKPIIEGEDGKASIRRVLTIFFSIGFIRIANAMTPSIDLLWVILAGIGGFLGLTTVQTMVLQKLGNQQSPGQQEPLSNELTDATKP